MLSVRPEAISTIDVLPYTYVSSRLHAGTCPAEWGDIGSMLQLYAWLQSLTSRDEDGQGLAEYALILALIAIVAIVALIFLGTQVSGILSKVGKSV